MLIFFYQIIPQFILVKQNRRLKFLIGQKPRWIEIPIDHREAAEFLLIDGLQDFVADGRQNGFLARELRVEIRHVFSTFLKWKVVVKYPSCGKVIHSNCKKIHATYNPRPERRLDLPLF